MVYVNDALWSSKDMQDGLDVAGLRVVNQFLVGNEGVVGGRLEDK
jgi:hypothetical protein